MNAGVTALNLDNYDLHSSITCSHEIKMDNSLLSLYASYKRATFIVLDWLESAIGNEKFSRASSRPTTTDVVKAATLVRDQKLAVPIYILSRLSDAIKKRRKVHGLYMEQHDSSHHEENLKHKAFIDR